MTFPPTDYAWFVNREPGTHWRRPDGVVVVHAPPPPEVTPIAPSPDHAWIEELETDKGGWIACSEVRGWERVG